MEETFFERERGQVVQCSCCSRSLAELNPLAPSLPSCNVPPIRDRRHPHFLQRRRRPRPPLSPSFLPGGLPACLPLPLSFSFNSRLILLFCITKDKSNLDLSPLPLLSAKNGRPPSEERPSDRATDRPSVRFCGRGTTSGLSAVAAAPPEQFSVPFLFTLSPFPLFELNEKEEYFDPVLRAS